MAELTYVDPYRAYNFKVEIGGVAVAHFTECSGMQVSVQPIAYRESGNSQVVHHVPGPVEYAPVNLRYGLTNSRELWDWFMTGVKGKIERKHLAIVLMDSDGVKEVTRWNLLNAWASEWRGAPLDAAGNEVAIETLTLVFETLDRAAPGGGGAPAGAAA